MVGTSHSARAERVLSEIDRLGHAGIDGLDLLHRATRALRPVIPFDAWCATTTDPASKLMF